VFAYSNITTTSRYLATTRSAVQKARQRFEQHRPLPVAEGTTLSDQSTGRLELTTNARQLSVLGGGHPTFGLGLSRQKRFVAEQRSAVDSWVFDNGEVYRHRLENGGELW
jgi:hypothetical protein